MKLSLILLLGLANLGFSQTAAVTKNPNSNQITWNGFASSKGKPPCRFHGRLASAPTGTFGTDFAAGDLYFNTANNTFYCNDCSSWKPM